MEDLKCAMKSRFSMQHRGMNMIWGIAMNEIKFIYNIESIDPEVQEEVITWYVRNQKLFIKTTDQALKIQIFKEKKTVLEKVNNKLLSVWYNIKLQDIIFK